MSPDTAQQLDANGYEPIQLSVTHHAGGRSQRTWGCESFSPLLNKDGTVRYGERRSLATVEFRYMSARHLDSFSRVGRRLSNALVELLSSGEQGPLVRRLPTLVQVIYRAEPVEILDLQPAFKHGVATRDEGSVLALHVVTDTIPVVDVAEWRDGRSPLNVPRASLPLWNSPEVSAAVHGLVERWVAQGDLRICHPYRATA